MPVNDDDRRRASKYLGSYQAAEQFTECREAETRRIVKCIRNRVAETAGDHGSLATFGRQLMTAIADQLEAAIG